MRFFALFAALAVVASANAQIVIDDFTTGSTSLTQISGTSYHDQSGSMLGGSRLIELDVIANPYQTSLDADVANGFSSISEGSGLVGESALGWGYTATADHSGYNTFDLNANLSSESAFKFDFAFNEDPMTATVDVNGSAISQFTVNGNTSAESYLVSFASFPGVDWSHVHQIAISFDAPAANDFTMSKVSAVPEPASITFLVATIAGFAIRRRRA